MYVPKHCITYSDAFKLQIISEIEQKGLEYINNKLMLQAVEPIGRDRFFRCLRERNLLVEPLKSKVYTTASYHRFKVYKNLLEIPGRRTLTPCHLKILSLFSASCCGNQAKQQCTICK